MDLINDVSKITKAFSEEISAALEKTNQSLANSAVNDLRASSPKKRGIYAKGWKSKKLGKKIVIFNSTKPQVTHLLEYGHAKKNGGRVAGIPHIGPVEKDLQKKAEEEFRRALK